MIDAHANLENDTLAQPLPRTTLLPVPTGLTAIRLDRKAPADIPSEFFLSGHKRKYTVRQTFETQTSQDKVFSAAAMYPLPYTPLPTAPDATTGN